MSLLWKTAVDVHVEQMPVEHLMRLRSGDYGGTMAEARGKMGKYPYDNNPHVEDYDKVGGPEKYVKSLADEIHRDGGIKRPIQIAHYPSEDGHGGYESVWDGHHRAWAAHDLGHTHVPVVRAHFADFLHGRVRIQQED